MVLRIEIADELLNAHKGKRGIKGNLYVDNDLQAVYHPFKRQIRVRKKYKATYRTTHTTTKIDQDNVAYMRLRCNLDETRQPSFVMYEETRASVKFVERMMTEV